MTSQRCVHKMHPLLVFLIVIVVVGASIFWHKYGKYFSNSPQEDLKNMSKEELIKYQQASPNEERVFIVHT